jgi:hypothetical protein
MERRWVVRRLIGIGVLTTLLTAPLTGCFVRTKEQVVACNQPTEGCVWVATYVDTRGKTHPAHWRCPGTVDAY